MSDGFLPIDVVDAGRDYYRVASWRESLERCAADGHVAATAELRSVVAAMDRDARRAERLEQQSPRWRAFG